MIGIDTNVLARAILDDSKGEASVATKLISKHTSRDAAGIYISSAVILELSWLLKSKKYSRHEIAAVLADLFASNNTSIGMRPALSEALRNYQSGDADFADYFILADAQLNGCKQVATFDKAFAKEDGCFLPK